MNIKPIAFIKTDFKEKFGIPRQSGIIQELKGQIIFKKEFRNPDALRGIEEYSHLWLIFDFSENHRENWAPTVRPPRLGGNERKGVFATRSPFRPNNLGLSVVRLDGIKKDKNLGNILLVSGVDLLNNTPIFDIKPYIPYCDSKPFAKGSFGEENKEYKINVSYSEEIFKDFPKDKILTLIKCLEQDPRPAYQTDERIYKMNFSEFEISFKIKENNVKILSVEKEKG